jgi:hypothetical protein
MNGRPHRGSGRILDRKGGERPLSGRDIAKFSGGVALLAILADAAVGHGLLWENDPYWTYWITKTFLIATVFGVGTALVGIGVGRGAVLTLVHTLVLTLYYWTLSPIGLPSHPAWLDLEHTWVTGLPVHFSVIYLGYLVALWLWRRRPLGEGAPGNEALGALATAIAIVVVAGGATAAALGDFPGLTWFIVRVLVTAPFVLVWWAFAGRDWPAAVGAAITLAFIWGAYGHFLGPSGLPDSPLRIADQQPPPAEVAWLDYRDLWLVSVPMYLLAGGLVLVVATAFLSHRPLALARPVAVLAVVAAPLLVAIPFVDAGGDNARVDAAGAARVERGAWYSGEFAATNAALTVIAEDRGGRVTPLPPHDEVRLEARVSLPGGDTYEVSSRKPMVADPLGRHGTWWGVGLDEWHHGNSGVGTERLPAIHSEVAVFAVGEVHRDGELIAAGVPLHVMTADNGLAGRLELNVGDEMTPVPGLPDAHLRVVWDQFTGGAQKDPTWTRYAAGATVLAILLALAFVANLRSVRRAT